MSAKILLKDALKDLKVKRTITVAEITTLKGVIQFLHEYLEFNE